MFSRDGGCRARGKVVEVSIEMAAQIGRPMVRGVKYVGWLSIGDRLMAGGVVDIDEVRSADLDGGVRSSAPAIVPSRLHL